jgi:glucuronate isomerase
MKPLHLHPDRLFPAEPRTRDIARALYATVADLPIISPHGHTDPAWFAYDEPFANPSDLLIVPDHYVFRMLMSQGVALDQLGIPTVDGSATQSDPRAIWHRFAAHYHLFAGTPSRQWLDYVFAQVFGIDVRLETATADLYYDTIDAALKTPAFRPRALFERFNIEAIATTEGPLDPLIHHKAIRERLERQGHHCLSPRSGDGPGRSAFYREGESLLRHDGRGCGQLCRLPARP